ncbi:MULTISPECIES: TetR family transcriptional regulator [Mycolicibacterium]|uniref:TetR family transcriptional regulator n=2 Tax=Mycolicibacterium gilvum TaxID=1804 RepID=A0A378SRV0_9MYCO|nr:MULTISPECIES: TetR family transcriptional regulator [Mycolicibacterium]ABP44208.1 transcriptional regulator, TetR family [Mycolicibacterium gilvum PYR-GCK]MBV5246298.1 TetR/AcrR family transcriptional regulator [Mycolicibacterium sp. PAM1]MCV7055306.1 TetR family transcriptional regulator [Mycolicibacterium gilvum]STZ45473.1 TetR family transcriptional regulator [Mycolicibacterium gilvum]
MAEPRGEPVLGLRERKKRRTRATLIDAAMGLCDRQGFDATTVDQIAAIAEVSPRTFSRYFATKDAIALALIDEVLDSAAAELARQPLDIGNFEALRRAYIAMARNTKLAAAGALTSERMLQILRIVMSSGTLRQATVEYRASKVDRLLAERMGTSVHDRRVKLLAAVWGAVLITAMDDLARKHVSGISVDDVISAFDDTYAEFAGEIAGIGQPV